VVDPVVGGRIEIVMQEGDGTRHIASGKILAVTPPKQLRYEIGPLGRDGTRLLTAIHELTLSEQGKRTKVTLIIRVVSATPAAAPALAGIPLGWEQALDKLTKTLGAG
jgi:uncharacterized protein YndB with AHSA1/START domain